MLDGELDILRTAAFRDAVLVAHREATHVVADMSEVTFMDSSGVRALLEVHGVLADDGAELTVRDPSPVVRELLTLVGLNEKFGLPEP
jgi:anti-anti-sigma factor